jgi:hypothetical protein
MNSSADLEIVATIGFYDLNTMADQLCGGEGGIRFASETILSATYRLAVATDASDPMGAGKHCPMLPDDIKLREVQ